VSFRAKREDRQLSKKSAVATLHGLAVHYDFYGDLTWGRMPCLALHGAYMQPTPWLPFLERFGRRDAHRPERCA
jgi:hypothetical protein